MTCLTLIITARKISNDLCYTWLYCYIQGFSHHAKPSVTNLAILLLNDLSLRASEEAFRVVQTGGFYEDGVQSQIYFTDHLFQLIYRKSVIAFKIF